MASHNDLGKKGEEIALSFLEKKGYHILEKNYRFEKSEIDIISKIDEIYVFTEVKTRQDAMGGLPETAVTKRKENLIAIAATHYLEANDIDSEIRYDIIAISGKDVHHIVDAFFPTGF